MFFKEVSYAHQGCIYLIKNTEKNFFYKNIIAIKITISYFNII